MPRAAAQTGVTPSPDRGPADGDGPEVANMVAEAKRALEPAAPVTP